MKNSIVYLLFVIILIGCSQSDMLDYERLTGRTIKTKNDFKIDEGGFRGEGYTIYINRMDKLSSEYFVKPNVEFFVKYPINPDYRTNWKQVKWSPTPMIETQQELLNMATPSYTHWSDEIIDKIKLVRELANQPGGYFAYYTLRGNVDFYLILPNKGLIITINHNM